VRADPLRLDRSDGAAPSFLSQAQADFITQRIFTPTIFPDASASSFRYDAATCTTTPTGDAGSP
jgi:hypothetical protein